MNGVRGVQPAKHKQPAERGRVAFGTTILTLSNGSEDNMAGGSQIGRMKKGGNGNGVKTLEKKMESLVGKKIRYQSNPFYGAPGYKRGA